MTRELASGEWNVNCVVAGDVHVKFKTEVKVDGKVWWFKGTIGGNAEASSAIKAKFGNLSPEQK